MCGYRWVGAVVVSPNRKVLGAGHHFKAGSDHAEVAAILAAQKTQSESPDKSTLEGCILYITLEPCSHYGRTPPCTDIILENGISRVVVGLMVFTKSTFVL